MNLAAFLPLLFFSSWLAIVVTKFFGLRYVVRKFRPIYWSRVGGNKSEQDEKVTTSVKNHPLLRLISSQKDDMRAALTPYFEIQILHT